MSNKKPDKPSIDTIDILSLYKVIDDGIEKEALDMINADEDADSECTHITPEEGARIRRESLRSLDMEEDFDEESDNDPYRIKYYAKLFAITEPFDAPLTLRFDEIVLDMSGYGYHGAKTNDSISNDYKKQIGEYRKLLRNAVNLKQIDAIEIERNAQLNITGKSIINAGSYIKYAYKHARGQEEYFTPLLNKLKQHDLLENFVDVKDADAIKDPREKATLLKLIALLTITLGRMGGLADTYTKRNSLNMTQILQELEISRDELVEFICMAETLKDFGYKQPMMAAKSFYSTPVASTFNFKLLEAFSDLFNGTPYEKDISSGKKEDQNEASKHYRKIIGEYLLSEYCTRPNAKKSDSLLGSDKSK